MKLARQQKLAEDLRAKILAEQAEMDPITHFIKTFTVELEERE